MSRITPDDFQSHVDTLGNMQSAFSSEAAATQSDASLSTTGQQARIATAWLATRRGLDAEIERFDRRLAERRATCERDVYGPPVGVGAAEYRDALDRAERADTEAEAIRLYERATKSGDTTFAKAIAAVGLEKGWTPITSQHFTGSSLTTGSAEELVTITTMSENMNYQLARGSAQQDTPRELRGLTRAQIEGLVSA